MSRNVKCWAIAWDASVRSQHKAKNPQILTNLNEFAFDVAKMRVCVLITIAADRIQFHVKRFKVCKYKNSPFYKGVELWNLRLCRHNCLIFFCHCEYCIDARII